MNACDKNPQRIVSLSPNLTDLVVELGAGNRLAGVTRFSESAPETARIVGDLLRLDFEGISLVRPDLVLALASGAQRREVERVRALGFTTVVVKIESLAELTATILDLGRRLGRAAEARILRDRIERAAFQSRTPKGRALLLLSTSPLIASASNTFEGDLLKTAGYENTIGALPAARRPKLSPEQIFSLDPDWIFVAEHSAAGPVRLPPGLASLRAVRLRQIRRVNPDVVLRAGPRADVGIREFAP